MVLENYTSEVFIENFLKDRHELGDDAQYIYEEIFSSVMGKDVHLDTMIEEIDRALEEDTNAIIDEAGDTLTEEEKQELTELLSEGLFGDIKEKFNKIFNPAGLEFNIFGGIKKDSFDRAMKDRMKSLDKVANESNGFFSRFKNKIKGFFGNLKGKSFGEIMKEGLAWFKDPANMSKALGTVGGVVLLGIILRVLKKRKKMREYNKLHDMAENITMEEGYEFGGNNIEKAKALVAEECKINKQLRDCLFGDAHIKHDDYFGY